MSSSLISSLTFFDIHTSLTAIERLLNKAIDLSFFQISLAHAVERLPLYRGLGAFRAPAKVEASSLGPAIYIKYRVISFDDESYKLALRLRLSASNASSHRLSCFVSPQFQ